MKKKYWFILTVILAMVLLFFGRTTEQNGSDKINNDISDPCGNGW